MNKIKGVILAVTLMLTVFLSVGCTISAYDIAVRNGYQGTEEQWLASLSGADGADGADLSIQDVYQEAVRNGYEGGYFDFLEQYLTFSQSADNSEAISKGLRSAVSVLCKFTKRQGYYEDRDFAQAGAGVIYKINREQKSAYIITNFHVVFSLNANTSNLVSNQITVSPFGEDEINAVYVGGSATYDIAVLKAQSDYFASDLPLAASVANSGNARAGQTVIAIGNPAGHGISATQGIISVDSEQITMTAIDDESAYVSMRVMRIDAAVNSGNSGGGLFDGSGSLIGIVNAKSADQSIENMSYAIPSSIATAVADKIIKDGVFAKGTLGITVRTTSTKAYLDQDGLVRVAETVTIEEATGGASGMFQQGDIILSIDANGEVEVTRQFDIADAMLRSYPGDEVTLKVLRNGQEVTVKVVCS